MDDESRDFGGDIQSILTQMGVAQKDTLISRSQERLTRRDSKLQGRISSSSSPGRDEGDHERNPRLVVELCDSRRLVHFQIPQTHHIQNVEITFFTCNYKSQKFEEYV